MKNLFSLILLAAIAAFVMPAKAQAPKYGNNNIWTMFRAGTTAISLPGSAATNIGSTIDCSSQQQVALRVTMAPKTTATDNISFVFQRSLNGVDYETAGTFVLQLAPSGTAGGTNTVVTNLPAAFTYGSGYVKLQYVTNAAAAAGILTNCIVDYATKISSP